MELPLTGIDIRDAHSCSNGGVQEPGGLMNYNGAEVEGEPRAF